jgi:hypothetical protein
MTDARASQKTTKCDSKHCRVPLKMAAQLFAELFYKQYMIKRELKRQIAQDEKFDQNKTEVCNQTNDDKSHDN